MNLTSAFVKAHKKKTEGRNEKNMEIIIIINYDFSIRLRDETSLRVFVCFTRSQSLVLIQRVVCEDELRNCMLINIPHCSHSTMIVRGIKSLVYY